MKTKLMALEALKQATKQLRLWVKDHGQDMATQDAIKANKAGIAAIEADIAKLSGPVAWMMQPNEISHPKLEASLGFYKPHERPDWTITPLYTTPQEPAAGLMPVDLLRVLADFEQYNAGDDEFGFMPTTGRIQVAADKARAMLAGGAA